MPNNSAVSSAVAKNIIHNPKIEAKPFVKWVGGKRKVLPQLVDFLPAQIEHYYEPFVGGGAMFFHLRSQGLLQNNKITLSDANLRLVRTYRAIRDNVALVISKLETHQKHHSKEYFYQVRDLPVDQFVHDADVAAWFIYLNKTAFNGLYRVNKSNQFNAPFGKYENPNICDTTTLLACHKALQTVGIVHQSFDLVCLAAHEGDFVYFDPPYVPVSLTASFTSYTHEGFGSKEQLTLRDLAQELKDKGASVMLSNADHPLVREWYKDFNVASIQVGRSINCQSDKRGSVGEVVIV